MRQARYVVPCMMLLSVTGCKQVNRMLGVTDGQQAGPIHILGAGQSNANNDIVWSRLATRVESYTHREVIRDYAAVSATDSAEWATNAPMPYWGIHPGMPILDYFRSKVRSNQPDFVLWMQGEGDANTPATVYAGNVRVVIRSMREIVPAARFFTALESFNTFGQGDPRGGQLLLVHDGQALLGPDVDAFRTPDCVPGRDVRTNPHFTDECYEKIGDAWFEQIKPYLNNVG